MLLAANGSVNLCPRSYSHTLIGCLDHRFYTKISNTYLADMYGCMPSRICLDQNRYQVNRLFLLNATNDHTGSKVVFLISRKKCVEDRLIGLWQAVNTV